MRHIRSTRSPRRLAAVALALAAGLVSCNGGGTAPVLCAKTNPSFATAVDPILRQGCSGGEICHGFGDPQNDYSQLVNVGSTRDGCDPGPLVSPGDVASSYLVNKLTGVGMCPSTQRMPPGSSLSDSQIQTIVDWICAGALDD